MIAAGDFLEWAKVHDNFYGTSRAEVFPPAGGGDRRGARHRRSGAGHVLAGHPEAHGIFVMPAELRGSGDPGCGLRGKDDEATIARRLGASLREMTGYDRYHYVIINDDARRAGEVLVAIILAKRHRRERMQTRVQEILRDFQDRGFPLRAR